MIASMLAPLAVVVAALPFFELRMVTDGVRLTVGESSWVLNTFGIPVDPWALLVCLGILLGMEVSRARAIAMGLDVRDIVDGILVTVVTGFVIAHVFTVVAYYPERLAEDGIWSLLRVWEGFSSTGGFLGGLIGLFGFYGWYRRRDVMRFADLIAFGFPVGWFFGRMGCAVVHDHIGKPTDSWIGMHFPEAHPAAGIRYELGLYEMLYMIPVMALFFWLGRKDRPPGTFMGLFWVTYAPIRFVLDFLRNDDLAYQDARYLGLTPAQYGMIGIFLFGLALLWYARTRADEPAWTLDGRPRDGLTGELLEPDAGGEAGA